MSKIPFTTEKLGMRFSEIVLEELNPHFSRITATVPAHEEKLEFGTVLTMTSPGIYAPFKGEGKAGGVLYSDLLPSETDQEAVIIVRDAILDSSNLIFDPSVSDKAKACQELEACGLILRNAPVPEEAAEKSEDETEKSEDETGGEEPNDNNE